MYVMGRETTRTNLGGTPVIQRRELEKLRDRREPQAHVRERDRRRRHRQQPDHVGELRRILLGELAVRPRRSDP